MANFLLLYIGGKEPESESEGVAVMKAWTDWFTSLGPAVVDGGNPTRPGAKTISTNGHVSDAVAGDPVTGYSILKADSLDEAAKIATKCPHLAAGGSVTVYETFPVM